MKIVTQLRSFNKKELLKLIFEIKDDNKNYQLIKNALQKRKEEENFKNM